MDPEDIALGGIVGCVLALFIGPIFQKSSWAKKIGETTQRHLDALDNVDLQPQQPGMAVPAASATP